MIITEFFRMMWKHWNLQKVNDFQRYFNVKNELFLAN